MGLHDSITKMNQLHKDSVGLMAGGPIVALVEMILLIVGAFFIPQSSFVLILLVAFFGTLFYWAFQLVPRAKALDMEARKVYKDTFLSGMFGEYFESAHYWGEIGFTKQRVAEFDIYDFSNRFESEDKLSGYYKGVHFEQADVHIWHEDSRNSSGNTRPGEDKDIHYFQGRMFEFSAKLPYIHSLKIYNKLAMDAKNDKRIRGSEQNRVQMESMEFNEAFAVYSEDAHEAFYILTPQMMERLMEMYNKYCRINDYSFHNMSLHFQGDKLYFALEFYGNAFDPGKFPISYPEEKAKLKDDIQIIIDLIESLDLIDTDNLPEREEEPTRDFWADSWTQEENIVPEEDKPKGSTGGLKLKL